MTEKTLRDEFAIAAMQGDWAAQGEDNGSFTQLHSDRLFESSARLYYRMADEMMKVREEQTP